MDPASPPFPTASNFLFHCAGIHNSNFTSGATTPATRQNAGTFTDRLPAVGSAKGPAGTDAAEVIVTFGSASVLRFSQGCCAAARVMVAKAIAILEITRPFS